MNKNDLIFIYDAIGLVFNTENCLDADTIEVLDEAWLILDKEIEKLGEASAGTTEVKAEDITL